MRANYSINYSASLSATSGPVSPGVVVVRVAERYCPATAANLGSRTTVDGIALDAGNSLDAIAIQIDGIVPAELAGFSAGAIAYAKVDTVSARLVRAASANPSDIIVGTVNELGDVQLSLGASALPSPKGAGSGDANSIRGKAVSVTAPSSSQALSFDGTNWTPTALTLDPRQFGASWDNVQDDGPSLQAMIGSIPIGGGFGTGLVIIDLPSGMGFCGRNLYVNRSVCIRGRSVGGDGLISGIRFGAGYGLFLDGSQVRSGVATVGTSLGQATDSIIDGVTFRSQQLIYNEGDEFALGAHRLPSTFYALGECRIKDSFAVGGANTICFFRVIVGGTTNAGIEPAGFQNTTPNITFIDGGVTWKAEGFPAIRAIGHGYSLGERLFIPGDNRGYWECTAAGTSSGATPLYTIPGTYQGVGPDFTSPRPTYNDTIVDGSVTWTYRTHSAVTCTSVGTRIRHCNVAGFTGFALQTQGDGFGTPATFASFSVWEQTKISFCGGGVLFNGDDSSGSCAKHISTTALSLLRTNCDGTTVYGQGGFTVWDRSLANHAQGTYAQATVAPDIVTGLSSNFLAIACRSENALGGVFKGIGDIAMSLGAIPINPVSAGHVISGSAFRRITSGDGSLLFALDVQDGESGHVVTDNDSGGNCYAWRYEPTTGEWRWRWGQQNALSAFGVTNAKSAGTGATLGAGNWIDYRGHWCGKATAQYWLGRDAASQTDANIAYGARAIGFRWEPANAAPLAGTAIGRIATVGGFDGIPRANGMTGTVLIPGWLIPPTTINAGGNVYKCTTAGVAAGAPPAFDSVPGHTTSDGSIVWTCLGIAASYSSYGKAYNPGTLTKSTAGAYALSAYEAAYECIEASGAAANITVTSAFDGQELTIYNSSGGGITAVGFAVANGQLFTGRFVGGSINAWKKQSLF